MQSQFRSHRSSEHLWRLDQLGDQCNDHFRRLTGCGVKKRRSAKLFDNSL